MLKKIDHHMLYMSSNRPNALNKGVTFRQNYTNAGPGLPPEAKSTNKAGLHPNRINKNTKPLQDSTISVSFKGLNFNKLFEPIVEEIPQKLSAFVLNSVKDISSQQYELYTKIVDDFVNAAKNDADFRKYLGINEKFVENLSKDNLIKIPKSNLVKRFLSVLVSPITMFKDFALWAVDNKLGKKLLPKVYNKLQQLHKYDAIVSNYRGVVGLSNYTRIQENIYRRFSGHDNWSFDKDLIIPQDVINEKLMSQKLRTVDPEKGQYSAKHLMLGNRLVSGAVYAGFLSNDAYNTTMRYSNNEEASQEQRASRAKQEAAKIGLNMYIHNLLLSTFESQINKSMIHALLASGVTVAAAEVMGRMLVGRPIFPSNKENLDRMEEKMQNKHGILAAVGRMIAGDKRNKPTNPQTEAPRLNLKPVAADKNNNAFGKFDIIQNKSSLVAANSAKAPSFKGLVNTPQYFFERGRLKQMLDFIQKLDPSQHKIYTQIIEKSLSKIEKLDGVDIKGKSLQELLNLESVKNIPLGENATFANRFVNGILSPVSFVKNTYSSLVKSAKKIIKNEETITKQMLEEKEFQQYLQKRLELPAWKSSGFTIEEKELRIYKEFVSRMGKNKLEANGVKNLILTLEKRFNALNIKTDSDEFQNLEKAKELLNQILTKADGANHTEYDANKVSQLNINLARAISTIFLVTDSFNLTMQYSNNNKKEAVKTAKNRAVQEASRIASSAYIMAFTHKIISKIYNGSLVGAFGTVLLTSTASDSLARAVVGVPILRKNQQELIELEEKQQQTKNPIRKALGYLIGKKVN